VTSSLNVCAPCTAVHKARCTYTATNNKHIKHKSHLQTLQKVTSLSQCALCGAWLTWLLAWLVFTKFLKGTSLGIESNQSLRLTPLIKSKIMKSVCTIWNVPQQRKPLRELPTLDNDQHEKSHYGKTAHHGQHACLLVSYWYHITNLFLVLSTSHRLQPYCTASSLQCRFPREPQSAGSTSVFLLHLYQKKTFGIKYRYLQARCHMMMMQMPRRS